MEKPKLSIRYEEVDDLVPYANNARLHSGQQVDEIVASIQEFGFCDPIGVWANAEGESEIIEGHGRLLALKKMGYQTAPVVHLDHLTDAQRRAYVHIHNKTTDNSVFDFDILDAELENLEFDWPSFGFGEEIGFSAIDDLMEEEYAANPSASDGETFVISFVFPSDKKEAVQRYVKEAGKEEIANGIVLEAEQWG